MNIIKFSKKNKLEYELFFDNNESIVLYEDIILEYDLLLKKEITDIKLEKIRKDNILREAYYTALKYLNYKMRSSYEIEKYLTNKEYTRESIDYTLNRLTKEKYLDDKKYTVAYINDKIKLSNSGPNKITNDLLNHKIDKAYIDEVLSSIDEEVWLFKVKSIIEKKHKLNKTSLNLFKSKMYSYLIGLGFSSDIIKRGLDLCKLNENNFMKEANREYDKLSNKFIGMELKNKFIQKMLSKGFSYDEIKSFIDNKL